MTPQGFNKQHRDITKLMLAGTAACLLTLPGSGLQVVLSAAATVFVSRGKVESSKNLKWLGLAIISFLASLVSFALLAGQEFVDADRAYEFKIKLLVFGQLIRMIWGGVLAVFIVSTLASDTNWFEEMGNDTTKKQ